MHRRFTASPDGYLEIGRATRTYCTDGIVLAVSAGELFLLDKQPNGTAFPMLTAGVHMSAVKWAMIADDTDERSCP